MSEAYDSADSGNDAVDEQINLDPCPSPGLFLFVNFSCSSSFCQVYLQDFIDHFAAVTIKDKQHNHRILKDYFVHDFNLNCMQL